VIKLPKNPNFGGVNRHFPAKRAKYWNVHIIKTTASIITKFCRVMETLNYSHCWWSKYTPNKSKMADGRHLEKSKNLNIFATIDRFWRNLAYWCDSTVWTPISDKISRFQKFKMAAAAILKIRKIAISPQRNDRFLRNLVKWCSWALQIPTANKNSQFRKSKMATAAILKNGKILICSQPIDRFWRNLVYWCV